MRAAEVHDSRRHFDGVGVQLPGQAGEFGFRAGDKQQVHLPGCQRPGNVFSDAVRGSGDDGVACLHAGRSFSLSSNSVTGKIILLQDNLDGRRHVRKSVPARRQTGRVGQLLFVVQQAAKVLAIERLEPLGLSPRAWGVLSTLAESGPVTQIELATTMSIDRTAMVYLLDELEDQALVERVRSTEDRRAFLIHLTPNGRKLQREAAGALAGAADTLLTPLDLMERQQLVRPASEASGPLARSQRQPARAS